MGTANARIVRAVHRYGYSEREVADFLELHYATVSQLANRPCYKKQDPKSV
jgi:transposase